MVCETRAAGPGGLGVWRLDMGGLAMRAGSVCVCVCERERKSIIFLVLQVLISVVRAPLNELNY